VNAPEPEREGTCPKGPCPHMDPCVLCNRETDVYTKPCHCQYTAPYVCAVCVQNISNRVIDKHGVTFDRLEDE